jgi:hypothetical protein
MAIMPLLKLYTLPYPVPMPQKQFLGGMLERQQPIRVGKVSLGLPNLLFLPLFRALEIQLEQ